MNKKNLLYFFLLLSISVHSQKIDFTQCKEIPVTTMCVTIEGFAFTLPSETSVLNIPKKFFTKDFKLVSSDPDAEITGFWYAYQGSGCDIYEKYVEGNMVVIAQYPIFKNLNKNDVFEFFCVQVVKKDRKFRAQSFIVYID